MTFTAGRNSHQDVRETKNPLICLFYAHIFASQPSTYHGGHVAAWKPFGQQLAWSRRDCSCLSPVHGPVLLLPWQWLLFLHFTPRAGTTPAHLVSDLTCVHLQFTWSQLSLSHIASQHHSIVCSSGSPNVAPDPQSQHHLGIVGNSVSHSSAQTC